jgi:hypothetical protein
MLSSSQLQSVFSIGDFESEEVNLIFIAVSLSLFSDLIGGFFVMGEGDSFKLVLEITRTTFDVRVRLTGQTTRGRTTRMVFEPLSCQVGE